jgi:hypothetical protein
LKIPSNPLNPPFTKGEKISPPFEKRRWGGISEGYSKIPYRYRFDRGWLPMVQAKVFIVKQPYKAKYKIYFVDQPYQEKSAAILAGGKLVKNEWEADVKVCIVQQEYQADIKIMRKNFSS